MTEPARIPCCIAGCRRSFKRLPHEDDNSETMCGKHYRCDPDLVRRRKQTRKRYHLINRVLERLDRQLARQGGMFTDVQRKLACRLHRLLSMAGRLDDRVWKAIKIEAQRQQDAGFFAPKPRRRANLPTCAETQTPGLSTRFEDQFQRLKRAQVSA